MSASGAPERSALACCSRAPAPEIFPSKVLDTQITARDRRLPPPVETALYRIVKEGLANVSRHARATRARVRVEHEGRLARCAVKDDGKGFDVSEVMARKGERGLGLGGMRQRLGALGGTLEIVSSPGRGTELQITIPLEG